MAKTDLFYNPDNEKGCAQFPSAQWALLTEGLKGPTKSSTLVTLKKLEQWVVEDSSCLPTGPASRRK